MRFKKEEPTTSIYEVVVVKRGICSEGHACKINPAFVLTRIPCSPYTFSTDEPNLLFYAEGSNHSQIVESLTNKLCHFWQIYGNMDEQILEENPDLAQTRENFMNRVTFEEANE